MSAKTQERPKPRLQNLDELFNLADDMASQEASAQAANSIKPASTTDILTIMTIPFDLMDNFKDHPFNLYDGERRDDMVESIKTNGILQPLLLRPKDNGRFEILSGHNRRSCAIKAGQESGPAIIKENLTDEEALMYVIETNLIQRSFSDMSHSEKAAVLAMEHSKLFCQGKRNDILRELKTLENPHDSENNSTSRQVAERHRSDQLVGETYSLSKDTVARYLRIAKLIPSMKQRLDKGEMGFIPAVTLSFLKEKEQDIVDRCLELNSFRIDMKKADILRDFSSKGKLNDENAYLVLSGELGRHSKKNRHPSVKVNRAVYSKYFSTGQSAREVQKIVEMALKQYFSALHKSRKHESTLNTYVPDDNAAHDNEMDR